MTRPSTLPSGGRYLGPDEYAALVKDMEQILQSSHLFKSLDEAGRAEILSLGYVQSFEAGGVIMTQGEAGKVMYLVMNGRVKVETETPGGTLHLAELGRGACVGEVSVLTGGPRTATVKAVDAVDAVGLAAHRGERVLGAYPKVREVLEGLVESRAKDTIAKMLD
ncbi:MAG: cyclic nucleotide-binding domain-containing protein [Myxococcota bacterium]